MCITKIGGHHVQDNWTYTITCVPKNTEKNDLNILGIECFCPEIASF